MGGKHLSAGTEQREGVQRSLREGEKERAPELSIDIQLWGFKNIFPAVKPNLVIARSGGLRLTGNKERVWGGGEEREAGEKPRLKKKELIRTEAPVLF